MYEYIPQRVCPRKISIDLDGDVIRQVEFSGGCHGNLKAISRIIQGMTIDEVAGYFEGNTCGNKPTSCADQLVRGLREAYAAQQN